MECRLSLRQLATLSVLFWEFGISCFLLGRSEEAVVRTIELTFACPVDAILPLFEMLKDMSFIGTMLIVGAGLTAMLLLAPWSLAIIFAEWRLQRPGNAPSEPRC